MGPFRSFQAKQRAGRTRPVKVRTFDFVITFQSFIYALALAHLLLAAAHMVRRRKELIFDWAHALWMGAALVMLWVNWIDLWDLHRFESFALPTVVTGFVYSIVLYLMCAFVSPDLDKDGINMHVFHETQSRTYIGAFAVLIAFALPINYFAGNGLNVRIWANGNAVAIAMLPTVLLPLFFRTRWIQVVAPIVLIVLLAIYMCVFYWVLR